MQQPRPLASSRPGARPLSGAALPGPLQNPPAAMATGRAIVITPAPGAMLPTRRGTSATRPQAASRTTGPSGGLTGAQPPTAPSVRGEGAKGAAAAATPAAAPARAPAPTVSSPSAAAASTSSATTETSGASGTATLPKPAPSSQPPAPPPPPVAAAAPPAPAAPSPPPSSAAAAPGSGSGRTTGATAPAPKAAAAAPVSYDKAMAAKINAARELARRLAEEKHAARAAMQEGKRAAEASAEAAAQAAKADALVRALRRAESNRDALQRLRSENEALRELLLEVAADKEAARARMEQILSGLGDMAPADPTRLIQGPQLTGTGAIATGAAAGGAAGGGGAGAATSAAPSGGGIAGLSEDGGPVFPASTELLDEQMAAVVAAGVDVEDLAAAAVEAKLVAASAQVAESLIPSKGPASEGVTVSVGEDMELVAEVRQLLQQKTPLESSEDTIKLVVKRAEQRGAGAAPEASAAATAVVQELHHAMEEAGLEAPVAAAPQAPSLQPPAAAALAPLAPEAAAPAVAESVPAAAAVAPPAVVVAEPAVEVVEAEEVVVALPEPSVEELQAAARRAVAANQLVFTWPIEGGIAGQPVRLYYNRARSPLPPSSRLQLKAGINKWEEMQLLDMEPAQGLRPGPGQEWWSLLLHLPADVFRLDYVVMDPLGGAVDNNGWRDFTLPLAEAPSEDEVMAARAEAYRRFDEERRKLLEEEEKRLWRNVESRALDAAAAARVEFRRRRDVELLEAARQVVADRRKANMTAVPAAESLPGVFAWAGGPPRPGQRAFLAYNKVHGGAGGGLPHAAGIKMHLGYDGWWNKLTQVIDLAPLPPDDIARHKLASSGGNQWWGAWVDVPYSAAVLDFVFSDRDLRNWDNNGTRDYHTLVAGAHSGEELVAMLHAAMKRDAAESDKEVEDRAALRAVRKVEAKGHTLRKRREVLHGFLYTLPLTPRAGQPLDVYYRPEATMLRGRPELWLRASWNRMGAAAGNAAGGALRPVVARLAPCLPGGLGFFKATVQVPPEAWGLDLSFSDTDSLGGGFMDDNGGLEYHVPVEGSVTPRRPLRIIHVAVEMAPIAKVGGMGDVVTALGRAVQEQGHEVSVIVPKYDCINYKLVDNLVQESGFNWAGTFVRVWRGIVEGLSTTFLEPENGMFWVGCIYGRNDDAARFGFFCGAALQYMKQFGGTYDILHCHDWQSAPVAWGERGAAKAVFTIHNLSYGADLIARAMQACDVATTVSPTYAREISGHPSVAAHLNKLYGVLNGIDQDIWDPSEDPCLPMHYSPENVAQGKEAARAALRQRLGLAGADVPVVGCVTRLVAQKGIHLIKHAAWRTLERGGQFVLLGSAPDARVQGEFNALRDQLARAYPDRAALVFTYDEPLSHLIYAGSDMFLVPSIFEPCGLTQMIAMRYGTIPVVRKTGGLVDTVYDVDHDGDRARGKGMETNGYSFEGTDSAGMDYALNRALSAWYSDRAGWHSLRKRAMTQDWSWNSPAQDYLELYYKAIKSS